MPTLSPLPKPAPFSLTEALCAGSRAVEKNRRMISKPFKVIYACFLCVSASMPCLTQTVSIACKGGKLQAGLIVSPLSRVHAGKLNVRAQNQEPQLQSDDPSRRQFVLRSVNVAVLAEAALNQSDPRTVVNSLLGMNSMNNTHISVYRHQQEPTSDEQVHTDCHS